MIIEMTRRKQTTLRGGTRVRSNRLTFRQKRQAHQTQKRIHADKGVFHKITPRKTYRFSDGRKARQFLRNRYKSDKFINIGNAAARSIANAFNKTEKIAKSVRSDADAPDKIPIEIQKKMYTDANKEHDAQEMAEFTNAFGKASIAAKPAAAKPYKMNPLYTSSYVPPKQRANQAARKLQSMTFHSSVVQNSQ